MGLKEVLDRIALRIIKLSSERLNEMVKQLEEAYDLIKETGDDILNSSGSEI